MDKKMYDLREKRLVEYIGAKAMADVVIGVRKEIERYQLDALPSDFVQTLLLHVGERYSCITPRMYVQGVGMQNMCPKQGIAKFVEWNCLWQGRSKGEEVVKGA